MKYPIQLGVPLAPGKFNSPVFSGIPTQQHILCRWPDGSVKHAILIAVVDGPGNLQLEVSDGQPLTGNSQMNVDARMELIGQERRASDLPRLVWFSGPLANCYVYVNNDGAADVQAPDTGAWNRPWFQVTEWPTLGNAFVRFSVDNTRASAFGQSHAPVKFILNGAVRWDNTTRPWYQQMMAPASRAVKSFWLNPVNNISARFRLEDVIATGAVSNYEPLTIPESTIAADYAAWQAALKEPMFQSTDGTNRTFSCGLMTKAMGGTGGRDEIGLFPGVQTKWLYSGDWRYREIAVGQSELGAQWGFHFRNAAGGIANGPTAQLPDTDNWGWLADIAHQPDINTLPWLLTGDFFHLEQLWYWMNASKMGDLVQTRAQAWYIRTLARAAALSPDGTQEKTKLTKDLNDYLAGLEWMRNPASGNPIDPLHNWTVGSGAFVQGPPPPIAGITRGVSAWEGNFMALALDACERLGFKTPLREWLAENIRNQGDILKLYMGANRIFTASDTLGQFTAWNQTLAAYDPAFNMTAEWDNRLFTPDGWPRIALAALATVGPLPQWAKEQRARVNYSTDPKWDVIP